MTTMTFDTLSIVKELEEAGMPRSQAEALANIQKNTVDQAIDARDLATKKDLLELKIELKNDLQELKNDLTRMFMTGMFSLAGVILAGIGIAVALLVWLIPARM